LTGIRNGGFAVSIFGSILNKIFSHANAAPAPSAPSGSSQAAPPSSSAPPSQGSFNNPTSGAPAPGQTGASSGSTASNTSAPASTVDVEKVLTDLASRNAQKLDWRHSIVDLMKLLDLDSSLANRKELAQELHYSGSTDDSAAMNIWLHKQVMQKLAANGGKVPDDLKS
jgi:hypothetical protein